MPAQITDSTIADNIRDAAHRAGIALEDLGARAGIADRTWWRRLTGRSPWLVAELISVSDVLDIGVTSLLQEKKVHSHAA